MVNRNIAIPTSSPCRVQDLWGEIARSPRDVEITPAQREEAERRLLAHESNPQECSTWEETKRGWPVRRPVHLLPEAERVLITAVFHGRRDPQRWSDRVREGAFGVGELDAARVPA